MAKILLTAGKRLRHKRRETYSMAAYPRSRGTWQYRDTRKAKFQAATVFLLGIALLAVLAFLLVMA